MNSPAVLSAAAATRLSSSATFGADGSENSATEELMWDYEGNDVVITLTRDYLRPNQAVTLRWAVGNEPA